MSLGIGPGVYGSSVWGSVLSTGSASISGLQVIIAGVNVSDAVQLKSFSVEEELNGRSQASMRLVNDDLTLRLHIGEPIICTIDGTRVFAGTLDEIQEVVPDTTTTVIYDIKCVDFNQLADRHYVAARFATANQTLYDVVTLILTTYSPEDGISLVDEGVEVNGDSVQTGPTLSTLGFNYQTAAEAFDDLAELVGFWWRIDYNRIIHFVDRATYRAPYSLDEGLWTGYTQPRVRRGRDQYRNLQVLKAGRDITESRVESFKGDGTRRNFELSLPVASGDVAISVNGSPIAAADIGVRQKDTGKKYYYQLDDKGISQDASQTVLTTSDTLAVTYRGFFPIIMQGRADEAIVERQMVEGGTGIYAHVENDQTIDDVDLAEEKVDGLLRRFASVTDSVTFSTMDTGWQTGQIMTVNLPEHELQGEFLITNVNLTFLGYDSDSQGEVFNYEVEAVSGEFLGGWSNFFKKLSKRGRPFSLRENDTILLMRNLRDVISIADTVSTSEALGAYTVDTSSVLMAGGQWLGRENVAANFDVSTLFVVVGPKCGMPEKVTVS